MYKSRRNSIHFFVWAWFACSVGYYPEVIKMAKKDMTHPDVTRGPRNETSPVPQIQGKAKSGKEKANPIIAGTTGASQKVWHEKPIFKAHGIIDTDLARDNLENDIPFADLQDL